MLENKNKMGAISRKDLTVPNATEDFYSKAAGRKFEGAPTGIYEDFNVIPPGAVAL